MIDSEERRAFSTTPANVAVERDFHRIDVKGLPPDALENDFAEFEGKLSQALERIIAARSIRDQNDRALLFNLIGLLAIKNPRWRESMRNMIERMAKATMDMITATSEGYRTHFERAKEAGYIEDSDYCDYEDISAFVENYELSIKVPIEHHLESELDVFDEVLPLIFRRNWTLFKAPPGTTGFITSDHPMCLMWSDQEPRDRLFPPGLGSPGTVLLFPISNELAAIGTFEMEDQEIEADDRLIAQINGRIILHANRQIYARDNNFLYRMERHAKIMRGAQLVNDRCFRPPKPRPPTRHR